jgi:BMFP domain-containing protein YqiC
MLPFDASWLLQLSCQRAMATKSAPELAGRANLAPGVHSFGARQTSGCNKKGQDMENSGKDKLKIEELAKRLLEGLPPGLRSFQADVEQNFRAVLRANLAKLDLVARDEFDAQAKVLARTRAMLEALELRVKALEAGAEPTHNDPA